MNGSFDLEKYIPRTRRAFGVVMLIALAVLAFTVFTGLLFIRQMVREQIGRRDAEALYATTLMVQLDLSSPDGVEVRTDEQIGFDAAVRASRLKGVLGIRFYDTEGNFRDSFPATIQPQPLPADALQSVRKMIPYSRLNRNTPLDNVYIYLPQFATGQIKQVPIHQITIPLHRRGTNDLAGAAQFIIEGESIAAEYTHLDHRLEQTAVIAFAVSGLILAILLWPTFRRSERLSQDLAKYSEQLERANEELALTARVSAVGAVSAHLMHGLKNPLASLSHFVSTGNAETDMDWQDALKASRRMQSLVERTLEVLSDTRGDPGYEITVCELGSDIEKHIEAAAKQNGVEFIFEAEGNCTLASHTANLISLILINLLENAIEATPQDGKVLLSVSRKEDQLCFTVRDQGPGFPEHRIEQLFLPGKSTREGGSGIGLAISKQIADHLEAKLEMTDSSRQGCTFILQLPMSTCQNPSS